MKNLLTRTLIMSVAILIAAELLPGVAVSRFLTALLVALVLSALNAFVRPILVILTLPITIFTLGLFLFIINALMVLLASHLVPGFRVNSVWWALIFSILVSIISYIIETIFDPDNNRKA